MEVTVAAEEKTILSISVALKSQGSLISEYIIGANDSTNKYNNEQEYTVTHDEPTLKIHTLRVGNLY